VRDPSGAPLAEGQVGQVWIDDPEADRWSYWGAPEKNAAFPVRFDIFGFANHTGLVAVLIVILLLAISNNFSIKKLGGGRWKNLQRWNYAFFALVLIHAVLYIIIENRPLLFILLSILLFGSTIVLQIIGFVRYRRAKAIKDTVLST
jgi:sulfoxide reductase heme-binding subunit YedZ